ncbi:TPA: hypothetical protein ACNJ4A_000528 [Citrobacter freundii]
MTALNKQALKPGLYAILFCNNWDGEGDTYETLASLDSNLIWHNHETGKELFEFEGDAVLKAWPLYDGYNVLALLDENLQLQRDKDFLEAAALAMRDDMREAREKLGSAEKRIAELRDWNAGLAQESFTYQQRVAELEALAVVVKQFNDFQIVHYGGSEDYAKGYIDCQNNYNKALAAAGIGVKGE